MRNHSYFSVRPAVLLLFLGLLLGSFLSVQGQKPWTRKDHRDWESRQAPATAPAYSLFLIGDAGKPAKEYREPTFHILHEALLECDNPSFTLFLGDNLYPYGLPDSGEEDYSESRRRILEQVKILDGYPGQAVFVPGNHDWAQGRKQGFDNILNVYRFFKDSTDRRELLLPAEGCPGPVELKLSPDLLLILIDTQWFLHKWEKPEPEDCDLQSEEDFYSQLQRIISSHPDRRIVVAGHHPMYSYGSHGGHYSWKEHLFPLTMGIKNAWLPLPVLGSMGVFYRKWRGNIQDIPHPVYRRMRDRLVEIFQSHPDLLYVCGHDHNLQYMPIEGNHYVVSGAGSKTRWVAKGKKAHFTYEHKGYARLDFFPDGGLWLSFHVPDAEGVDTVVYREELITP